MFKNKVYDVLKWVAIIALPAIATLVSFVFKTWGLPYGPEVSATITAVATCLGALLVIDNVKYNKKAEKEAE